MKYTVTFALLALLCGFAFAGPQVTTHTVDGAQHFGSDPARCLADDYKSPGPCRSGAVWNGSGYSAPAMAEGASEIDNASGELIFYVWQVSHFHLEFADYIFEGYRSEDIPRFPASNSPRAQRSESINNPQHIVDGFDLTYQSVGQVRTLEPLVRPQENSVYAPAGQQVAVTNFRLPSVRRANVWFVIISGMVTQTVDRYNRGVAFWREATGIGLDLGARLWFRYDPTRRGLSIAEGMITLGDVLRSYQRYQIRSLKTMDITLKFKNSLSGEIVSVSGSTDELVPVLFGDFTFFYGNEKGRLNKIAMRYAIGKAIQATVTPAETRLARVTGRLMEPARITRLETRLQEIKEKAAREGAAKLTPLEKDILEQSEEVQTQHGDKGDKELLEHLKSKRVPIRAPRRPDNPQP